ncbi:hypothetical protein GYMLUDRAFT_1012256 [Collybiopsis luxurians FD-317 M1]|uniref:Unplaced genomic scaffold GYMLUscaffold_46, whole genome shotgun sequence n=1 Tax=Collybiopsis luxurians FD-317 M1 TaxID=944289 RepID=A0A0D0BP53_9AGAR|nr:hypothetical protein GYMLUDRAFT_1012256 [Collybiopsis luxurians FD-317 M1]
MQMAGINIEDQDVSLTLTLGLPPSYDAIIISFDSMDLTLLALKNVITQLLNKETHQASSCTYNHIRTAPSTNYSTANDAALTVTSISCHPVTGITYSFCMEKGHYWKDCGDRNAWERSERDCQGSSQSLGLNFVNQVQGMIHMHNAVQFAWVHQAACESAP